MRDKDGRHRQGGMKDGLATHSSFFRVDCISLLHDGSIAVSDSGTCLLRLIISSPFGGKTVTTIAGGGEASRVIDHSIINQRGTTNMFF